MQLVIAMIVTFLTILVTNDAIPRPMRLSQWVVIGLVAVGAARIADYIHTSIAGLL